MLVRTRFTYVLAVALIAALVGCAAKETKPPKRKMNVLICVKDALRARNLSCYGYERNTSPFLDQWAAGAILFERASSQSSWTYPSLGSLFTGLYPSVHGIMKVRRREGKHWVDPLSEDCVTLAEVLQKGGWDTMAFVANPWFTNVPGLSRGFEGVDNRVSGNRANGDRMTDHLLEWLQGYRAREDRSEWGLFLYLHYMDTHAPYVLPSDAERPFKAPQEQELIPQEKWEKVSAGTYYVLNNRRDIGYYVASYDNCIRFADGVFQRVVENVRAHPEEGDWIIVFTADHGESLFEGPDRTANDHGWTLYDYELHVPLIISAPAYGFEPKRIKTRVQLLDLPETIAEMLGIQWPLPTQGRSLLPLMELGHSQEQPAIAEWSKQQANISIHLGSWHFIEERNLDTRQLFNLNEDPEELVDRGKDNPEMFDQMLRIKDHFMSRRRVLSLIFRAGEERMLDEEAIRHLQGLGYLQ